jgi:hypothetical protein
MIIQYDDRTLSSVETGKKFSRAQIWYVLARVVEARQRWFDWGVNKWLGHDGVVESCCHHQMRGSRGPQVGETGGETGGCDCR